MTQQDFILTVLDMARIVPGLNPEATAAHAAVESGYGQSLLATEHKALFGIKVTGWKGKVARLPTWEVVNGQRVEVVAEFRAYETWAESVADYGDLVRRVYPWAAQHSHDPVRFLVGLFALTPKYATDPDALAKSVAILEKHGLLLRERLGVHEVLADNSPSLGKAVAQAVSALQGRPAVFGPHLATRTRREDGSWKLDVRAL